MELNSRKATSRTSIASMLRNLRVPVPVIVAEIVVPAAAAGQGAVEVAADDAVVDVTVAAEDMVAMAVHAVVMAAAVVATRSLCMIQTPRLKVAAFFFCNS